MNNRIRITNYQVLDFIDESDWIFDRTFVLFNKHINYNGRQYRFDPNHYYVVKKEIYHNGKKTISSFKATRRELNQLFRELNHRETLDTQDIVGDIIDHVHLKKTHGDSIGYIENHKTLNDKIRARPSLNRAYGKYLNDIGYIKNYRYQNKDIVTHTRY
jgi:hypothetical protein